MPHAVVVRRFGEHAVTTDADESGLSNNVVANPASGTSAALWTCCCAGCTALTALAQGGSTPGSYATSPNDNGYSFFSQALAPQQGSGGDVATLIAGTKWTSLDSETSRTVITFSFANPQTSTFSYSTADYQASLTQFSAADQQLTREILARIEAVCNVQFVEVADNATEVGVLRYGYSQQPNSMGFPGYAFFPAAAAIGGDIWLGAAQAGADWDFYRPDLLLHETLHALGLKHSFGSGAVLPTAQDIIPNTVMSYSPVAGGTSGYMSDYPAEPMALDIAALQYLYGASALNAGDTVYDLAGASFQKGFHALWDAGGNNTFDASRIGHGVTLDLNQGGRSDVGAKVSAGALVGGVATDITYSATLSIAAGTVIQDAAGTAYDDVLIGNNAINWLSAGAGNDRLEGRGGNDFLIGGTGNDKLLGGDGLDTAVYHSAHAGFAIARTDGGYTVSGGAAGTDSLVGVERLWFSDRQFALDLDGNAGIAAKTLGAVFGTSLVKNGAVVGLCLKLLDGGVSSQALMDLALDVRLGADASNAQVVDLLWSNIGLGAAERASWLDLLDRGSESQAALGQWAADSSLNLSQIDFVGLAATGIEYIG
jgi:serralysin